MARGMIGRTDRERELEEHIEGTWGPQRRENLFKRMAIIVVLVMILSMALFVGSLWNVTSVEDTYAVVYTGSTEMYIGQLDLSASAWDSLITATTITLYLDIPDWDVAVVREMTYFNRTVEGERLDYLSIAPFTGQVLKDTSGRRVDFQVRIVIETPSVEVSKLRFLGTSNSFTGTLTNHPDKPVVELGSSGKGVELVGNGKIEVRNEPERTDIEYWFVQFTRTQLS